MNFFYQRKKKNPKKINVFTVPHAFLGDMLFDKFAFYQRRYISFSCHQTINNVVSMDLATHQCLKFPFPLGGNKHQRRGLMVY